MNRDEQEAADVSSSSSGRAALEEAGRALVDASDRQWAEISDRVLDTVLSTTRRSHLMEATAPGGPFHVSEQVVIAGLRDALDGTVPGSAVARIHLDVQGRGVLVAVVIEVIVAYGRSILPLADELRRRAVAALEGIVGQSAPAVDVRAWHVHVSDVVEGDPGTADPWRA